MNAINVLDDKTHLNYSLQSKNGGLAAWEPAGASEWLEVTYFLTSLELFTSTKTASFL